LRHEVAVRERALTERQEAVTAVEFALHGRIQALQQELARGRSAVQVRESELDQLRGEADSRRVRVTALESAADIEMAARHALESDRAKLESDLAGLHEVLDGKEAMLRAAEIALRAHQEQSAGEIAALGRQVDEQKGIIDQGATDLDQLRAESARWREQNNQSEQSRHELELNWRQTETRQRELAERLEAKENELRWVQSNAHEQQETAFRAQAAQFEASDGELRGELARLRSELEERQKSTEQTQQVLEQLNAEIADLREQLAASLRAKENELQATRATAEAQLAAALRERLEVESRRHSEDAGAREEFDQARKTLDVELKQLRNELQQKSWALAQQQASMGNLALAHQQHVQKLEDRFIELHNAKDPSEDLGKARLETSSLQRRIEELDRELRHAQLIANQRAEQISQDDAAQIEKLSAEISRQSGTLEEHEPALTRQEQLLRGEIESLILEAQEKNQILQNRNDELVRAKSERDMLQERLKELESATNQNEAVVSEESEQMRTEFQAQLALLQAELSQKEWALEEQCASVSGLDQQYREQIEGLNQKLAQAEAHAQQDPDPFVIDTDKINGAQQQQYSQYGEVAEMPTRGSNYPHLALGSRRWRTRLDRKRRWRTSSAVAQSSYQEILVSETKKDRNIRKDSQ
jgi:chromosome segregation ATPase